MMAADDIADHKTLWKAYYSIYRELRMVIFLVVVLWLEHSCSLGEAISKWIPFLWAGLVCQIKRPLRVLVVSLGLPHPFVSLNNPSVLYLFRSSSYHQIRLSVRSLGFFKWYQSHSSGISFHSIFLTYHFLHIKKKKKFLLLSIFESGPLFTIHKKKKKEKDLIKKERKKSFQKFSIVVWW